MPDNVQVTEKTIETYKSDEKPTWCPGCGDFGVLNALYNAVRAKGWEPKDIVLVSGIGCSSRLPFFANTYGFHGVHGRVMPIATGVRVANPELKVLALGGDGDAFAIGGGHFIHAARRNLDVCYVIMDNAIYGLTKGQTSPTSSVGFVTKSTPKGSPDRSISPLLLALASGATFVARAFSGRPKELAEIIVQGIDHNGFAVVDCYSPCPTFNKVNTFKAYREETANLPEDYDPTDRVKALEYAAKDEPLYLGVFYREQGDSFEDHVRSQQSGGEADAPRVIEAVLNRFS
jgi:2-oxoglutarate ferredoxin oxidoreductase subunit beta